jgi:undecaprenyl-diphosphatase
MLKVPNRPFKFDYSVSLPIVKLSLRSNLPALFLELLFVIPEILQIVILAIVQGIAEFLPISSSGHLVALSALFGKAAGSVEVSIVLHFGTLLSILVFYRQRIGQLLLQDRHVIPLLIIGTVPAAVIGIWVKQNHEEVLENALLAGLMMPVTAFVLMSLPKIMPGKKNYTELSIAAVLLIGFAQAFALLPGISRSGMTIVAGSLVGMKRQSAATFSFLLAIPAIAGASLFEARHIMEHGSTTPIWLLAIGALIAFAVGLLALRWLVHWVETGKLHLFAYWLLPVGFLIVIWQLYEILAKNMELATG